MPKAGDAEAERIRKSGSISEYSLMRR